MKPHVRPTARAHVYMYAAPKISMVGMRERFRAIPNKGKYALVKLTNETRER